VDWLGEKGPCAFHTQRDTAIAIRKLRQGIAARLAFSRDLLLRVGGVR
jgi:hypothetical protein